MSGAQAVVLVNPGELQTGFLAFLVGHRVRRVVCLCDSDGRDVSRTTVQRDAHARDRAAVVATVEVAGQGATSGSACSTPCKPTSIAPPTDCPSLSPEDGRLP